MRRPVRHCRRRRTQPVYTTRRASATFKRGASQGGGPREVSHAGFMLCRRRRGRVLLCAHVAVRNSAPELFLGLLMAFSRDFSPLLPLYWLFFIKYY